MCHVAPAKFEYTSLIGQHNTNGASSDHVKRKISPLDFTKEVLYKTHTKLHRLERLGLSVNFSTYYNFLIGKYPVALCRSMIQMQLQFF